MADVDILLRLMAQNNASTALDSFGKALQQARKESERLARALQDVNSAAGSRGFDTTVKGMEAVRRAAQDATKAIEAQIAALRQWDKTPQPRGAGPGGTPGGGGSRGASGQAGGGAGAGGGAVFGGRGGQEDPVRRGGFGLMEAAKYSLLYGGLYAGYSAVSSAFSNSLAFNKTLYSTQALTGLTDAQRNQVQANVYASSGSGSSQFDPNSTLGAQYAALSTVPNVKVAGQISAAAMKAAAVSNVTDPTDYGNAITTMLKSYYGGDTKAIGANANMVGSQLLYAIRQGKANPADIPGAVGTFASSAANAGASMPDILGLFAQDTLASRDARVSGQGMEAFLRNIGKPSKSYMAEAKKLGISQYFGPDAIKKYGVGGVISGIEGGIRPTAAGGDHQDEFINLLFQQQNARDVFKRAVGPGGSNLGATLGAIQGQRQAGAGYLDTANDQYMKSPAAQLTGSMNQFKTSAQQFADAATPLASALVAFATSNVLKPLIDLLKKPGDYTGGALSTAGHAVDDLIHGRSPANAAFEAGKDQQKGDTLGIFSGPAGVAGGIGSFLDAHVLGGAKSALGVAALPMVGPLALAGLLGGSAAKGGVSAAGEAVSGMFGGTPSPTLPAGIFATHGGYENQKTHVLYQTIAAAAASLTPTQPPPWNTFAGIARVRQRFYGRDITDASLQTSADQQALFAQESGYHAGNYYGTPGMADAALAARQAAARSSTAAGKGVKGLPMTLDPYQSSQDTMSLAIMQQQNPAHIRQALGGVLWQIAHSGADPKAQDLASAQARLTANTAIAAELKAPADKQMAAAQLFQQTVQIHGGNIQQQQTALGALIAAMRAQGAGLKGADAANWATQTGNAQFLGQQAIDQSTVGKMQSQLALARSKGDIKGERRIAGQIAQYQAANAAYLFPGDTSALLLSNQGLTQGVGSDQATLLNQKFQLAQAQGNGKLASSLISQILAADKTSGMNPQMLALTRIQLEGGIPQRAGPQNIRPANMGPGDLEATFGNVAGRSARLGGQDAGQRQMMAALQQQLEASKESETHLREQLAEVRNQLRESRKQTALQQKMLAALLPETKTAPVAAHSSRTARHVAGH